MVLDRILFVRALHIRERIRRLNSDGLPTAYHRTDPRTQRAHHPNKDAGIQDFFFAHCRSSAIRLE
jgi:hypothetical protein